MIRDAYLVQLYARSESVRTRDEYARVLKQFLARWPDPSRLTPGDVRLWAYSPGVRGRPVSASYISMRLCAVRGLLGLALQLEEVRRNVTDLVPRPKGRRHGPKGLARAEFERVLAGCPDSPAGREERAILTVAVLTALRRAEMLRLSGQTMQWRDKAWWYRVRAKAGREAHAELPREATDAIGAMLKDRNKTIATLGAEPVFAFSGSGMWRRVVRAGARVGLKIHVHQLKHSAALAAAAGLATGQLTLWDLQDFLGHTSLATTQTYLRGLTGRPALVARVVGSGLGIVKRRD